jgi:hypothetical protein
MFTGMLGAVVVMHQSCKHVREVMQLQFMKSCLLWLSGTFSCCGSYSYAASGMFIVEESSLDSESKLSLATQ